MKNIFRGIVFILHFSLFAAKLSAQNVAINTSGNSAYVSAILDLSNNNTSGTVGFLPPYVTFTLALSNFQLSGTAAQSNGIIVYNTGGADPAGLYYWNNSIPSWVSMGGTTAVSACVTAVTNDIPIFTNSTTICNSIINQNAAGTMIGIGLPVINTEQQNLSVYNGAVIDQAGANAGTITNVGADQNLHFGGGSGEGIGSNRNNSSGYEEFGLQFYTGTTLAMNISNMISVSPPGQVAVINGLNVDQNGTNNGLFNNGATTGNGLSFGTLTSGEGIASKRTGGGNQYGLDFYTNYDNRMSVTNAGNVGIGTNAPNRLLEIGGITNTIRIDGLITTGTFYSANTATTAASSILFASNTSGDVQALAPSVTNGQVLTQTAGGPAWQGVVSLNNIVVITNPTVSYTPTAGTTAIQVELIGAGGGGGGTSAPATNGSAGGGGGSGGYVKFMIANPVGPYTVAVGLGGAGGAGAIGSPGGVTTFTNGVTYTAGGGSGGAKGNASYAVGGGAGGVNAGGALISINGNPGGVGVGTGATGAASGPGGSSVIGGGGVSIALTNTGGPVTGTAGFTNSGAGGSGGVTVGNAAATGGAGANGVIIITEYK